MQGIHYTEMAVRVLNTINNIVRSNKKLQVRKTNLSNKKLTREFVCKEFLKEHSQLVH